MNGKKLLRSRGLYASLGALLIVLLGAALLFSDQLTSIPVVRKVVARVGEPFQGKCAYDLRKAPIANFEALIDEADATRGNAESPVKLIEFFDPNCPHCKTLHPTMKQIETQFAGEVHFIYKPIALWEFSVPQVAALYEAEALGFFSEMLEAQFEHQQQGSLSIDELRAIAVAIGMDADAMADRIASDTYLEHINEQKKISIDAGLTGVPAVIING